MAPARRCPQTRASMMSSNTAETPSGEITVNIRSTKHLIASVHVGAKSVRAAGDGAPAIACPAPASAAQSCRTPDGSVIATLTTADGAAGGKTLRLGAADGSPRWSVELRPDKLLVGRTADAARWTITRKPAAHAHVTDPQGHAAGTLKSGPGRATTVLDADKKPLFTVEGAPTSVVGALLLVDGLAGAERLALIATLLARGV